MPGKFRATFGCSYCWSCFQSFRRPTGVSSVPGNKPWASCSIYSETWSCKCIGNCIAHVVLSALHVYACLQKSALCVCGLHCVCGSRCMSVCGKTERNFDNLTLFCDISAVIILWFCHRGKADSVRLCLAVCFHHMCVSGGQESQSETEIWFFTEHKVLNSSNKGDWISDGAETEHKWRPVDRSSTAPLLTFP